MAATYYQAPTGVAVSYVAAPVAPPPPTTVIFASAQPITMKSRTIRLFFMDIFFLFVHLALAVLPAATFRLPDAEEILILRIILTLGVGPLLRAVSWVIIAISMRSKRNTPEYKKWQTIVTITFTLFFIAAAIFWPTLMCGIGQRMPSGGSVCTFPVPFLFTAAFISSIVLSIYSTVLVKSLCLRSSEALPQGNSIIV